MAPPIGPLVDEGTGEDRAAFIADLIAIAAFYATHEDFPLPGKDADGRVTLAIQVPGESRGVRLEALAVIAERMGGREAEVPDPVTGRLYGLLMARKEFSRVSIAAVVGPDDSRYLARRQDALRQRAAEADDGTATAYESAMNEVDGQLADEADAGVTIAAADAEAAA